MSMAPDGLELGDATSAMAWGVLAGTLGASAAMFASLGMTMSAWWAMIACAPALLTFTARRAGGVNTIAVIFVFFHLMYGLSGPTAVLFGGDLPAVYSGPFATSSYLESVALASIGIVVGASLCRPAMIYLSPQLDEARRSTRLIDLAIWLTVVGSLLEVANVIAAGGTSMLGAGKATYQSALTGLPYTLHSYEFAYAGVGAAGLSLAAARSPVARSRLWRRARWVGVALLPLVGISIMFGRRGPLASLVVVAALALTERHRLSGVGPRVFLGAGVLYTVFAFIFAYRFLFGLGFATGDWSMVRARATDPSALIYALNPANSEFGAPFGNYSEFYRRPVVERRASLALPWNQTGYARNRIPRSLFSRVERRGCDRGKRFLVHPRITNEFRSRRPVRRVRLVGKLRHSS
jgi:hypothetical protein